MEPLNDKLRKILAEAVITFCQQHALYIDELKIQGTVVVTTDCSSIFLTQLSEKHRRSHTTRVPINKIKVEPHVRSKPDGSRSSTVAMDDSEEDAEDGLPYNHRYNIQSPEVWYQPGETVFPGFENPVHRLPTCVAEPTRESSLTSSTANITGPVQTDNKAGVLKNVVHPLLKQRLSEKISHTRSTQVLTTTDSRGPDATPVQESSSGQRTPAPPISVGTASGTTHAAAHTTCMRGHDMKAEQQQHVDRTSDVDTAVDNFYSNHQQQRSHITIKTETDQPEATLSRSIASVKPAKRSGTFSHYKCPYCIKSYRFSISLKRHIETRHLGRRFKCKHCDTEFDSVAGLSSHTRMKHKQLMQYECHICGQRFNTNSAMGQHITRLHYGM